MTDFSEDMDVVAKRSELVEQLVVLLPETTVHCLKMPDKYRITWTKPGTDTKIEIEAPEFAEAMEKAIERAKSDRSEPNVGEE